MITNKTNKFMSEDIKIIDSEGASIGVTKSLITNGTMLILEDISGKIWIDLNRSQVKKLIEVLNQQL